MNLENEKPPRHLAASESFFERFLSVCEQTFRTGVPHGRIFELFKNLRAAFYEQAQDFPAVS